MSNPISDALAKVEESKPILPPFSIPDPLLKKKVEETKMEKPVIVETPVPIQELTTQQKLDEAQEYLDHLNSNYSKLGVEISSMQVLVSELAVQADRENPKETNQDAISSYLASKNKSLEARSHRIKLIAESGLQLKDLAQGLKSPIDARLSRKSKKR